MDMRQPQLPEPPTHALLPWARVALQVPLRYAQRGQTLAHAALAGARRFEVLRHHPAHDAVDRVHGTRFYYHAHGADRWGPDAPAEHGHFHLFWDGAAPGEHVHLAALALDARGQPLRWFTTNGWVTAGRWLPAARLIERLPGYRIAQRGPLAPVARWLTAMVQLFADELVTLLHARDAALARHRGRRSLRQVLDDRAIEVLSHTDASLPARLQRLGLV
ncbi:MAG: hypothetical protein N2256_03870 [Tepidimonas ignava]|nr:hypothetical protein [Tepidimonas ignava]